MGFPPLGLRAGLGSARLRFFSVALCGAAGPVLVTAQGLLMYFLRPQVHQLIAAIAKWLPGASMIFDVVPKQMLEMVRRLPGRDSDQAATQWTWVFDAEEREAISEIPGVAGVRDLNPPIALGLAPLVLGLVRRLPRRARYALPVFPVLEITFS